MIPPIAACLGFRNWHLDHARRCLESLLLQESENYAEVCLVDLGSEEDRWLGLVSLTQEFGIRVIRRAEPEWSRSIALNEAARCTTAPLLFFTDADMVQPREYLASLAAHYATLADPERTLLLTRSRDYDRPNVLAPPYVASELEAWTRPHSDLGMGAGMVIPRAWFEQVGGFDEVYRVWGCDDCDIVGRADWDGLRVEWIPDTFVVHQEHPRDWPTPEQYEQVRRNRAYYAERIVERGPIVRNRREAVRA